MADHHQPPGPPGPPIAVPRWTPPPPPHPPPPLPPPLQIHQPQHLMYPPPGPPYSPFPPNYPPNPGVSGFVHRFAPQRHQQQQQKQPHYYNSGNHPFSFHGPPTNQGSFGYPPPFPPPLPQRALPQMTSGMVSPIQSWEQGDSYFRVGNAAQNNRSSPLGIGGNDNLGFSKEEEGITVIEKVIEQTEKGTKVDVTVLLSQIQALVVQAEEAVQKVGKLAMLEPSTSELHLVTCPYDPSHRVSAKVLFKHFLCCPSNPKPHVDAEKVISSLQYPCWEHQDDDSGSEKDDHCSIEFPPDDVRNAKSLVSLSENWTEPKVLVQNRDVKDQIPTSGHGTGDVNKASGFKEIDIWGGRFFYKDSPAVVQVPLPTPYPSEMCENRLAPSVDQVGPKLDRISATESIPLVGKVGSLVKKGVCEGGLGPLLPSRFWFLLKEVETWKELPTWCSTLVLQAACGFGRIRRKMVSEWVLMQGPNFGVVIDAAMATHIHSLASICLKSVQTEASTLVEHHSDIFTIRGCSPSPGTDPSTSPKSDPAARCGTENEKKFNGNDETCLTKVKKEPTSVAGDGGRSFKVCLLDCPRLFQSGDWLASQLSCMFGPSQGKAFVLKLLKHCLVMSGRILASFSIDHFKKQASGDLLQLGRSLSKEGGDGDVKPSTKVQTLEDVKEIDSEPVKSVDETVAGRSLPLEVDTAIAAIHERAVLESYLRTLTYPSLAARFQMIQEHEATVMMAEAERRKRENYRPVLEHDGLIWHRSQLEEKNKNKTREEILAEERDYKRRRMSYRGKKLKRNPTEVLHDLIGAHMEEIVEAGGIGQFVKHTGGLAPSAEAGGVDISQRSNQSDVESSPLLKSHQRNPNAMDNRSSWNGPPRGRPGRRNDHFSEQSRSGTGEQDVHDVGARSQDNRDSEMEDGGSHNDYRESKYRSDGLHGKSYTHNSHHTSYSGKDNLSFHSTSGRDDVSYSTSYWMDSSSDHSMKDYKRDQSRSLRSSERREGSNEEDGYERRHSREHRGK
ncbi:unnamed protein product [Calypogeia fissa]